MSRPVLGSLARNSPYAVAQLFGPRADQLGLANSGEEPEQQTPPKVPLLRRDRLQEPADLLQAQLSLPPTFRVTQVP